MRWQKVTLIGVGLLGGSLGMALRRARLAHEVVGLVRRRASVAEVTKAGAADWATLDERKAVKGADLIVLCTPVGQMKQMMQGLVPYADRRTIVTDVGSVKDSVVRELEPLARVAGLRFVGSHPMAGSEKAGVAASAPDLFKGSICVVTPTRRTDCDALERVEALWLNVGGQVLSLSPQVHDRLVSRSSHLPYILAACLSRIVLDPARSPAQAALCANGFRDTTRIASGSPEMWADIEMANRREILRSIVMFERELGRFKKLLEGSNASELRQFSERGKILRDRWQQGTLPGVIKQP